MPKHASSASVKDGGALVVTVAFMAAAFLVAHMAIFLTRGNGYGVFFGGFVGLLYSTYLSSLAIDEKNQQSLNIWLVAGFVLPALLTLIGLGDAFFGWLALGAMAMSLMVPLVQWCCDSQPQPSRAREGQRVRNHPFPGAVVAGVLFFAMPNPSQWAPYLAVGYFGSLLLVSSLGEMLHRARTSGQPLAVEGSSMTRWLAAVGALVAFCTFAGIGLPALSELRERQFQPGNQGLVQTRPSQLGGEIGQAPTLPGTQDSRPNPGNTTGSAAPKPQPGASQPAQPRQPPPPPPPTNYRDLAIRSLVFLLVAGALLWIVRRYGPAIIRAADRLWRLVFGPIHHWLETRRELAVRRARERTLRIEMDRQDNPFDPLPEEPSVEDLTAVYRSLVATAYLLGTEPGDAEMVSSFVNRLADGYSLDRRSLAIVAQVCSRGMFAPTPPTPEERRAASAAATNLSKRVQSQIPEKTHEERKNTYRRLLAERSLNAAGSAA